MRKLVWRLSGSRAPRRGLATARPMATPTPTARPRRPSCVRRGAADGGAGMGPRCERRRLFADRRGESAHYVVAMDADPPTVESLYRRLREEGEQRILPLVVDVCDPSHGLGWRGRERLPLEDRGRPELTLCLALVHHLAITRNVPLAEIVDWLAGLGGELVLEFPTREDPMVSACSPPSATARTRTTSSTTSSASWKRRSRSDGARFCRLAPGCSSRRRRAAHERRGGRGRRHAECRLGPSPWHRGFREVEPAGIEPATSCLQSRRSPS